MGFCRMSGRNSKGQFVGGSGNPAGKPALSPELKAIKELTTDELKRTIAKHFRLEKLELQEIYENPHSIAIDLVLVSAILKAIDTGDIYKAESLFMRCLGKVTDKIELQHPEPLVIERANGEQVALDVKRDE